MLTCFRSFAVGLGDRGLLAMEALVEVEVEVGQLADPAREFRLKAVRLRSHPSCER